MRWFPFVGAVIGLVLGLALRGASEVWTPFLAAGLVVALDLALTGMLHFDGLADSADGLLPPIPDRTRRLAIMADPTTGAFGASVIGIVLLLRLGGLASATQQPFVIAAIWCASRTLMAVAALCMTYVRKGGLVTDFLGPNPSRHAAPIAIVGLTAASALATAGALVWWRGTAAIVATVLAGVAVLWLAHRRIGGITGDVLGAAAVVGETAGLLALAAAW